MKAMKGSDVIALLQRAVGGEIPRCETAKQDFVKSPRSTSPNSNRFCLTVDRRVISALKKDVFLYGKTKEWYCETIGVSGLRLFVRRAFCFWKRKLPKSDQLCKQSVMFACGE